MNASHEFASGRWSQAVLALVLVTGAAAPAGASVSEARALYQAASYEEALTALGNEATPEALEYRALCLLALNRVPDAERALEELIKAAPALVLSGDERPPRFMTLFTQTRRRVLPAAVRGIFADARAQYQAKSFDKAKHQFNLVMTLTNDAALKDLPEVADLRLLAGGFDELLKAADKPGAADTSRTTEAAAAPRPATVAKPASVVQPSLIKMNLPAIPTRIAHQGNRSLTGAVWLKVDAEGRVTAARIERHLHPEYDLELLAAARQWLFTPASINGVPTESEAVIPIQIKPPEPTRR
jgi:tetratricopeptide (TPR) repeat protein